MKKRLSWFWFSVKYPVRFTNNLVWLEAYNIQLKKKF